jgi:hypothetical protein
VQNDLISNSFRRLRGSAGVRLGFVTAEIVVCTDNLNASVVVMKSTQDGA